MIVVAMSVVVSVSAMTVPGMSATIAGVEHRASEVEVVTVRIAGVDAEVPVATLPVQGTIEIGGCTEELPLPVDEHVAQVEVTTLPVNTKDIVIAGDTHQIVEVDFVGSLVLLISQVQLVSHLVREEEGLVPCLLVAHCLARCCDCQHCYQGHHYLLHNYSYFNC